MKKLVRLGLCIPALGILLSPAEGEAETHVAQAADESFPPDFQIEPDGIDPTLFFGPSHEEAGQYRLGPEDVLEVTVFEMSQFDRSVRVSGDGSIDLPLIGAVQVGGLDPEQAAARVAEKLREEYVRNPQVSIFVKEFNARKLSLLGAVARPATYLLLGNRSLLQLLAEAGGVAENAGRVLYVFRQSEDGRRARLVVPLNELLVQGDPRWDIWLRPADVVSVPPEEFIEISVLGAVERPGVYELSREEAFLMKALALAQWLNRRGSRKGIEIQRTNASENGTILKINLEDILSGKKPDVLLREGDVVYVNEKFF